MQIKGGVKGLHGVNCDNKSGTTLNSALAPGVLPRVRILGANSDGFLEIMFQVI